MVQRYNYADEWYDIDHNAYEWSVKLFRSVQKVLGVHLKLHAGQQVAQGDIFLFNHFSRFETFIPQYLIYNNSNAYSCAIASAEFFKQENSLSNYLKHVGVFPHDHQRLFPLLAMQVLRGRKVIIFPEGGMVKDRNVIDKYGRYRIFSRLSGKQRKLHTGPAVLAQGLETFKAVIRNAYNNKNFSQLEIWQQQLQLDSLEQLLLAALKPTLIVPANITFYPIRATENVLHQGVEFFSGKLSLRQTEELLIEGNLILKDTDMDVRMGKPVDPYQTWFRYNRYALDLLASQLNTLDDVFLLGKESSNALQKSLGWFLKLNAKATRNQYMKEIYSNVTINLCHLASTLIMYCISKGQYEINQCKFYNTLYLAIKILQDDKHIKLHRSLLEPEQYDDLITCHNQRFEHFICLSKESGLIAIENQKIRFLDKLREQYDFDNIRLENLIAVYNNEAAPIKKVLITLIKAYKQAACFEQQQMAYLLMDDQNRRLAHKRQVFNKQQYSELNSRESFTADAHPMLLQPEQDNGFGVLLIHGLLASPAELAKLATYLTENGFTVLCARIDGHGTSPFDLQEKSYEDWYQSIKQQMFILNMLCKHSFVIGFSTGGALGIKIANEFQESVIGVVAVSLPYKFIDPALMLIPLLHSTNTLIKKFSILPGVKPFIENKPENPEINYRNIPIRSLYELRRLIQDIQQNLHTLLQPVLFIFADKDPIVAIDSAQLLMQQIKHPAKTLKVIQSEQHGILKNNTRNIWQMILHFMNNQQQPYDAKNYAKNCISERYH